MSSNVYEDPNLTMNVRYSKGVREDGGGRQERLVDIYESADTFRDNHVDHSTLDGGGHTQNHPPAVQRNPFRVPALVLGPLCLLLVVGITALSKLYISIILDKHKLSISYKELQISYNNLSISYCQPQGDFTGWTRFQCSCYYKSTEMKNWSESRKDCQKRGADLVIIKSHSEQKFVTDLNGQGDSWIGLRSVRENWEEEWQWVDSSTPEYKSLKSGATLTPEAGSIVYIDQQGKWTKTNYGTKQWICEKQIY